VVALPWRTVLDRRERGSRSCGSRWSEGWQNGFERRPVLPSSERLCGACASQRILWSLGSQWTPLGDGSGGSYLAGTRPAWTATPKSPPPFVTPLRLRLTRAGKAVEPKPLG
jgi:hypothetical protein